MALLDLMKSYARGAGYVSPTDTAATYQQILLDQSRDVNSTNDMTKDSLNNLLDPDVIEKGTTPDYSKRLTESEFRRSGLARQPMSAQERWKNTIDSMIKSGNPVLQRQGIESLNQYFSNRTNAEDALAASEIQGQKDPNSYREYLLATRPENRSPEGYAAWLEARSRWKAQNININNTPNKYVTPEDAAKLQYLNGDPVLPYTPEADLVGKVRGMTAKERETTGKLKTAIAVSGEMEGMLFGDGGIYAGLEGVDETTLQKIYRTAKGNVEYITQSDPRYKSYVDYVEGTLSPLVKSLGESGALATEDVDRARALVPVITGLHPDSPPVAREKMNKLMRLIKSAQSTGMLTNELMDALDVPTRSELKKSGWTPWWEKQNGTVNEEAFNKMKPFGRR